MYARDHAGIATPIGTVRVSGGEDAIEAVTLCTDDAPMPGSAAAVREAARQLAQWFAGERIVFDVPLAPLTSPRGMALRDGLVAIPYGETRSYGALAHALGSGPRAIGQLCARNPFPIIVPCHRVTGAGGTLGNYSGGRGPVTKIWLLDHERRHSGGTLL
jgi:methylated-DNA-[protein]-cysteine S-methyltransferase